MESGARTRACRVGTHADAWACRDECMRHSDERKIEHMWRSLLLTTLVAAGAQDLPRGQIVDAVKCLADASQSYSLYLPSNYSPDRQWNVVLLFDAGGRGRRGVERYQAAAQQFGYILAGSNNSRNGPWEVSIAAARAMNADVRKRFTVNPKRVYTAGM